MNRIDLYASFISEQVYMDEIFGDRDRGYPYEMENPKNNYNYKYHIDLHDNVHPAGVSIMHGSSTAHVAFSMPRDGYGISPEAKKTYHKVYNEHLNNNKSNTEAHIAATQAVLNKHSAADAKLANDAMLGGPTITRPNTSKHHNYGIFSTMKKIMNDHGKNHPDVKQFMITSSGDVENRDRMYGILAKKHGGKTNVDSDGDVDYTIPNPHHKKET